MKTKIIEATNGTGNWGKFLIGRFDTELDYISKISEGPPLIHGVGWGPDHLLVLDLQTGEGAVFAVRHTGLAEYDLAKRRIWVCPLLEPFLTWLYQQDVTDLDKLQDHVDLPNAPFALWGHRRSGEGKLGCPQGRPSNRTWKPSWPSSGGWRRTPTGRVP